MVTPILKTVIPLFKPNQRSGQVETANDTPGAHNQHASFNYDAAIDENHGATNAMPELRQRICTTVDSGLVEQRYCPVEVRCSITELQRKSFFAFARGRPRGKTGARLISLVKKISFADLSPGL